MATATKPSAKAAVKKEEDNVLDNILYSLKTLGV